MGSRDVGRITAELQEKYPEAGIQRVEIDEASGKSTFYLEPNEKVLASLPADKALSWRGPATASTIRRDAIDRSYLDLSTQSSPYESDPKDIYRRAIKYYYEEDYYGTHVDILSNLASKGFENDIDDSNIKHFYDTWNFDVNFRQVLDWIFQDLFRVGMVRTYKVIGKYEPGVSYLSPIPGKKKARGDLKAITDRAAKIHAERMKRLEKSINNLDGRKKDEKELKAELAAKKKVWSKGYMPIAYTVLNPLLIDIEGSLLFDKTKVVLKPSEDLKKLLQKDSSELTDDEKLIIKLLPNDFKKSVEGTGGIELDPMFVGAIDYRKQPYERYAKPRGIKVFEALEYKKALRQADLSTLDGISNYILKITIGNDEYPCTDQTQLDTVAKLFNTPSKSFDVVWNHTLEIEKIVSPEIEAILGQDKYKQVNEDISGGLAISRALVDGITNVNQGEASLIIKSVIEEVHYARRQVERWIYKEYQQIAEAAGFDRFPKVRWDNTVLKDIILYMATISQLVDRRMLSYETALEELGFDFPNELNNMQEELPMVLEGTFGIVGSPFQKAKMGVQDTQNSPEGTPSGGRPKGQPAKKKQPNNDPNAKTKVPNQAPSNQPSADASMEQILAYAKNVMTEDQYKLFARGFIEGLLD